MTAPIPPGAVVRAKANDCGVPKGAEGIVAYIHPDSGHPVVRISDRTVALTANQLEIITMPQLASRPTISPLSNGAPTPEGDE